MPPPEDTLEFGAGVFGLGDGDSEAEILGQESTESEAPDTSADDGENFEWLDQLGKEQTTHGEVEADKPVEQAADIPAAPLPPGQMTLGVTDADMARAAQLGVPVNEFLAWGNEAPQKLAQAERYIQFQKTYAQPRQEAPVAPPPPPVFNEQEVLAKYAKDYEPEMAKELVDAQRAKFEAQQARREIDELRQYMHVQAQQSQQMQAAQAYNQWTGVIKDAALANPIIAPIAGDPAAMQAIQNETLRIMNSLTQAGQPMLSPEEFTKRAAYALYGDQIIAGAGAAQKSSVLSKQDFQAGATARPRPAGQQKMAGGREAAIAAVSQLPAFAKLRGSWNN
jgi:hypothetical protein